MIDIYTIIKNDSDIMTDVDELDELCDESNIDKWIEQDKFTDHLYEYVRNPEAFE